MKALSQIIGIFFLVGVAGFGSNMFRSDSLHLWRPVHIESRANASEIDRLSISLKQAEQLYQTDQAIFVDARPGSAYQSGHIKGAINLPWQQAEERVLEIVERIPMDKPVVTYCDGDACNLSHHLAKFLKDLGYARARSLHNGLSRWQAMGLPLAESKG